MLPAADRDPTIPAEPAAVRYINGDYAMGNPEWHQADSPWKATQIAAMISRNNLSCRSIVDVGCGAGEVLVQLQRQLPPDVVFTGFEISPQAVRMAQKKAGPHLSFRQAAFPDEFSDLLLLIDVFEHVENPLEFLRSLRPHARRFIFHIPLDLSVLSVWREWPLLKRRRTVGHLHYFTRATALATLEDAGYEVRDWFYPPYPHPLGSESLKTVLIRRLPEYLVSRISSDCAVRIFGDHSLLVLAEPSASM